MSGPVGQRPKTCSKCGGDKTLADFKWVTSTYRLKDGTLRERRYQLNYCNDCKRVQDKDKSARRRRDNPRYQQQWRRDNPDKARAIEQRYNSSDKGKAARDRYAHSPKGRAAVRRYKDRKFARRWGFNVPSAVVAPYIERLRLEFGTYAKLAEATGIHMDTLRYIATGKRKQVTIDTLDLLSAMANFGIDEIYDRAQEYALLLGDRWPTGYHPRTARRRRKDLGTRRQRTSLPSVA